MHNSVSLVAPVLLAVVLLISGAAKLRAGTTTEDAFISLRLPEFLRRMKAPTLLPWGELLLAVLLLVTGGVLQLLVAIAALVLFGLYVVIIARALRFDEKVECSCFGKLGLGAIDTFTLIRNIVLFALAVWALVDAAHGDSVIGRLGHFDGSHWGWLVAVLLAGVLGALIAHRSDEAAASSSTSLPGRHDGDSATTEDGEEADYLRQPVPYGVLRRVPRSDSTDEDGRPEPESGAELVTLRDLTRVVGSSDTLNPTMLVFVSLGCGPCVRVMNALPDWAADNAFIATVAIPSMENPNLPDLGEHVTWMIDPDRVVAQTFGASYPTAILIGADGLLAGGPVFGGDDVLQFLTDVHDELVEAGVDPATGQALSPAG